MPLFEVFLKVSQSLAISMKNGAGLPIDFGRGVARAVYLLVGQSVLYSQSVVGI